MSTDDLYMEMADCENTLLREIAEPACRRKDVAQTYALALLSSERTRVDWGKVNRAIIARWSLSALEWIKTQAWKQAQGKQAPLPPAPHS